MQVTPFILGSGRAATAILEALRVLEIAHPEFSIHAPIRLKRGEPIKLLDATNPVLFIANPHALHAPAIIEGERAGFKLIVSEKPSAVNLEQVKALGQVKTPVALLHVYRQMWGLQTLKEMIKNKEFGELISIEGRYWQSSTAQRSLSGEKAQSWKNDPNLSGPSDVLLDIGTHWADAALFLMDESPKSTSVWRSYVNAEAPHRDSHAHITMEFASGVHASGSISKTVHGAPNHFEINVIGSKKYACWKFLEADQIEIGEGSTRSFIGRKRSDLGSGHPPFHGMGWLEGYVEIIYQALKGGAYPTLAQNLQLMSLLLS